MYSQWLKCNEKEKNYQKHPKHINQSINQSIKKFKWTIIAVTVHQYGEILRAGKWQWKKVSFWFMFKCRQCHWWRHFWRKTVPGFCSAATQNARSPTVWRHVCGTARSADDAERKRCRPGRSATCCRLSVRCVGARSFRHRNASSFWNPRCR